MSQVLTRCLVPDSVCIWVVAACPKQRLSGAFFLDNLQHYALVQSLSSSLRSVYRYLPCDFHRREVALSNCPSNIAVYRQDCSTVLFVAQQVTKLPTLQPYLSSVDWIAVFVIPAKYSAEYECVDCVGDVYFPFSSGGSRTHYWLIVNITPAIKGHADGRIAQLCPQPSCSKSCTFSIILSDMSFRDGGLYPGRSI